MDDLIEALVVTAEVIGTELSKPAAKVMLMDLAPYPRNLVLDALRRVRRECKGRLSLSDILSRIDDGRPGADEAWAMWPRDEQTTAVLTGETLEAMRHAQTLLSEDRVAARMAFKDAYTKLVQANRDARLPVTWIPTLGYDAKGRAGVLIEAVQLGRLSADEAIGLIPNEDRLLALTQIQPTLALPINVEGQKRVRALVRA